jgi:predicted component of type VI protein secretion system
MDFQLLVVRGRAASTTISLADGVTTVGRHDECQLRVKSSQVSRKHCEIFEKKGLLLVKDLKSSNGTFVNGKKIDGQRVLEPGDELMIGQITLKVIKKGAVPADAAPAPAAKPNDTAVTKASPAPADLSDDDFDLDFDEDMAEPDSLSDSSVEEKTTVTSKVAAPPPTPKPAAKPAEPEPADAPSGVDDAVADFLLDIKFDEDEE